MRGRIFVTVVILSPLDSKQSLNRSLIELRLRGRCETRSGLARPRRSVASSTPASGACPRARCDSLKDRSGRHPLHSRCITVKAPSPPRLHRDGAQLSTLAVLQPLVSTAVSMSAKLAAAWRSQTFSPRGACTLTDPTPSPPPILSAHHRTTSQRDNDVPDESAHNCDGVLDLLQLYTYHASYVPDVGCAARMQRCPYGAEGYLGQ